MIKGLLLDIVVVAEAAPVVSVGMLEVRLVRGLRRGDG